MERSCLGVFFNFYFYFFTFHRMSNNINSSPALYPLKGVVRTEIEVGNKNHLPFTKKQQKKKQVKNL